MKTGAGMASDCVSDHKKATGFIVSLPPNENLVVGCYKLAASGKLDGDKSSPRYALFDIDRGSPNFWGKQMIFLGEYANIERISKEVEEIHKAISQGIPTYMLQYRTKTKWHWVSVEIVEE